MKYSENFVWECVGRIMPSVLMAKNNGVPMNLPASLKSAACECWLRCDDFEFKQDWSMVSAGHVIRVALEEIETVGWMTFGTQECV